MTTRFVLRFLSLLALSCVVLTFGLFFSPSAAAQEGNVGGKAQERYDRASKLEEKGKIKKSEKVYKSAVRTEAKAQRKYDRAIRLKKRGKIKKYNKLLLISARLGHKEAQEYIDDVLFKEEGAGQDTGQDSAISLQDEVVASSQDVVLAPDDWAFAQLGDADSLYKLGEAYVGGSGVERNPAIAYAMFLHAERRGSGEASDALKSLVPKLSVGEIAKGEDVYRTWRSLIKANQSREKKLEDKQAADEQLEEQRPKASN